MNTKHTPGPWKYIAWHGQHGVHDAMDNDVCETFGEDAQANARVIAAAPDLLAASQAWHYAYSECTSTDEERRDAKTKAGDMTRAAIDKATKP